MPEESLNPEVTTPPAENVDTTQQEKQPENTPIDVEAIKAAAAREVAALFQGAMSEKEKELERLRAAVATPVRQVQEEDIDGATFLNAPKKHIKEIIQAELQQQLQPIQELWGQFSRSKQLEDTKKQYYAVPAFKEILDTYGDVVDQIIGTGPVTPQSVQMAITMVPGLIQTGQLPSRKQPNGVVNKSETVPPTITPSSPPVPKKSDGKPTLQMTDKEREIARKLRMSDEQYVLYRDADSTVDTWKK